MTIRIEHTDETVDTVEHLQSKVIKKFGETGLARLFTPRVLANQITLEEGRDEVYLEDAAGNDEFGGRLKNIERDGPSVELVVDSFERDARKAEPTPAGQRRENVADDVLVQEAVDAVPGLSAGTIQQLETGLTFVFSHSSQAKKIRTVEEATSGEVRYNADKTVDYVNRIGQDRSGTVTISPGNQNLDGKIKVKENGGQKNITHLRMLGAGEGRHQMEVNIVPDTDTADYPNKVTYTGHDWEMGNFKDWDTFINKEITSTDTLEREGLTLIDELNSKFVELEATIKDVDVAFGDTVYVKKPKDNIDRSLRIVEWQRIDDKDGLRYKCTLSSRLKTREKPGTKDRKDVQRYNKAFEGSPVTMTAGGGRQPVSTSLNYEFDFYYPAEVEYEHRVKLFVKGLAYRAYSQGAGAGGDHSHSVDVTHPSHDHNFTVDATSTDNTEFTDVVANGTSFNYTSVDNTWTTVDSFSPSTTSDISFMAVNGAVLHNDSNQSDAVPILVRLYDSTDGTYYPDSGGFNAAAVPYNLDGGPSNVNFLVSSDVSGHSFDVQANTDAAYSIEIGVQSQYMAAGAHNHSISQTSTSDTELGTTSSETSDASGDHTHPPEPGVIESFGGTVHYPSNCDVTVNGTAVGVSMGDGTGPFEQEVDLAGMLNPGQVNTVRISSDSLGHIQSNLDVDVYRQILGDG